MPIYGVEDKIKKSDWQAVQTLKRQSENENRWDVRFSITRNWMVEMVNYLAEQYEVTHKMHPTVFRNLNSSSHRKFQDGMHQLVFSHQTVMGYMKDKRTYREYASVSPHFPNSWSVTELKAIYYLTIHEFAHVLQTEIPGGRTYGDVHNSCFISQMRELEAVFTFEDAVKFLSRSDQIILGNF